MGQVSPWVGLVDCLSHIPLMYHYYLSSVLSLIETPLQGAREHLSTSWDREF